MRSHRRIGSVATCGIADNQSRLLPQTGDDLSYGVCRGLVCFQGVFESKIHSDTAVQCSLIHCPESQNCELFLTQPDLLALQKVCKWSPVAALLYNEKRCWGCSHFSWQTQMENRDVQISSNKILRWFFTLSSSFFHIYWKTTVIKYVTDVLCQAIITEAAPLKLNLTLEISPLSSACR